MITDPPPSHSNDSTVTAAARRTFRSLSVIIPTLNEADYLPRTLVHAWAGEPMEVIVADGGSRDDTLRIAQAHGATVICGEPTRARQMNAGASVARGDALLFLHADTLLPTGYRDAVLAALAGPGVVGGAFRFGIADDFRGRRIVEAMTNLRSRWCRLPYGDQALFLSRRTFDEIGGFAELSIMEDFVLVRRLLRIGCLAVLNEAALTSGRRWQRRGVLRTTLMNQLVVAGYLCGVDPTRLAACYRADGKT